MIFQRKDGSLSSARLFTTGAALLFAVGCGGSANASGSASAKASTDAKADANLDAESETAWDQVDESQDESQTSANATPSQPGATPQATQAEQSLFGARHDLQLGQGAPAACQCVAVVLGQPADPGIVWTGRPPVIDPNAQMIIALGSEGVPCAEEGPGASYMGHEKQNGDVIVTVEAAVAGRPVTHGAIIPRPDQGKKVFLQPSGKIPYGRGKAGEPRCALAAAQ